jgi:hypothetical protein
MAGPFEKNHRWRDAISPVRSQIAGLRSRDPRNERAPRPTNAVRNIFEPIRFSIERPKAIRKTRLPTRCSNPECKNSAVTNVWSQVSTPHRCLPWFGSWHFGCALGRTERPAPAITLPAASRPCSSSNTDIVPGRRVPLSARRDAGDKHSHIHTRTHSLPPILRREKRERREDRDSYVSLVDRACVADRQSPRVARRQLERNQGHNRRLTGTLVCRD